MFHFKTNMEFTDKYTLLEKIGVGGFAEVWKVKRSFGFEQAIKIFTTLDKQGELVAQKEFEALFNLNHPKLLKAVDFGVFKGHPYLVMPYCANGNALRLAGTLDEVNLIKVMGDISSALAYLHELEHYIIHQDIKPDNFLIDNQGDYLLADFGISRKLKRSLTKSALVHRETQRIEAKKNSGITPLAYRPPEVFEVDFEKRKPVKASDIWSLGSSIFEMATTECPFQEYGGMLQRQGQEIPNLPKSQFTSEFNELLKWCMNLNPWDRPTAVQLNKEIRTYQETGIWPFKQTAIPNPEPEPITIPIGDTIQASGSTTITSPSTTNKSSFPKLGVLIGSLLLLIMIFGGGYIAKTNGWFDQPDKIIERVPQKPSIPVDTDTSKKAPAKVVLPSKPDSKVKVVPPKSEENKEKQKIDLIQKINENRNRGDYGAAIRLINGSNLKNDNCCRSELAQLKEQIVKEQYNSNSKVKPSPNPSDINEDKKPKTPIVVKKGKGERDISNELLNLLSKVDKLKENKNYEAAIRLITESDLIDEETCRATLVQRKIEIEAEKKNHDAIERVATRIATLISDGDNCFENNKCNCALESYDVAVKLVKGDKELRLKKSIDKVKRECRDIFKLKGIKILNVEENRKGEESLKKEEDAKFRIELNEVTKKLLITGGAITLNYDLKDKTLNNSSWKKYKAVNANNGAKVEVEYNYTQRSVIVRKSRSDIKKYRFVVN